MPYPGWEYQSLYCSRRWSRLPKHNDVPVFTLRRQKRGKLRRKRAPHSRKREAQIQKRGLFLKNGKITRKNGDFKINNGELYSVTFYIRGIPMRNEKNHADRCEKVSFSKHPGVCRTYNPMQLAYAQQLQADDSVAEFRCNVPLTDFELTDGVYTSDFVCTTVHGEIFVRETIKRSLIERPKKLRLLDASREYWTARGVIDWGVVIDA